MRAVASAVLLTMCAAVLAAQQPPFKAENRTVAVYATVTSADGRLVPDLTRDAFAVYDNGKRQELSLFAADVQPISVVMLLDRSASMRRQFTLVEQAAEEFVNALLPSDQARIGSFSNRIQVDPREFTSDHAELLRILRTELQEEGPTPLWNAVNVGLTALLHQQGRRVILVFTDGMDSPMNFSNQNSSLKDVMKRAEEEDVMVYAIGLAGGGSGPRNRGGYGRGGGMGGRRGMGGRGGMGGGYGGYGGNRGQTSDKPDPGLAKIAAVTGGGYFELTSTNDLASTFSRVVDELHRQYTLGFTPLKLDGKMHRLELKLADPALVARARKSYLAPSDR